MNNLADKHPEKVKQLSELWFKLTKEQGRLKRGVAPVSGKKPPLLQKSGVPEGAKRRKKGK